MLHVLVHNHVNTDSKISNVGITFHYDYTTLSKTKLRYHVQQSRLWGKSDLLTRLSGRDYSKTDTNCSTETFTVRNGSPDERNAPSFPSFYFFFFKSAKHQVLFFSFNKSTAKTNKSFTWKYFNLLMTNQTKKKRKRKTHTHTTSRELFVNETHSTK